MRRDLQTSLIAVVLVTVVFGLAYPLAFTGVSQVLFSHKADGSRITEDGELVGSSLIGQDFRKIVPSHRKHGPKFTRVPDPRYFQPRPSQSNYDPSVTFFSNLGPNSKDERAEVKTNLANYLKLERPHNPGLTAADVPVDAITQSASGVDPDISKANAEIQAHRIADVRHLPLSQVDALISDHTDGRFLGLFGEPGVNVLELNLALDKESPPT
jgi:potassium-transporting ATPase KdpC subunit